MIKPIRTGFKTFKYQNGDTDGSGIAWWLFRRIVDNNDILDFCDRFNICRYQGGPGQPYSGKPVISHSLSYTLITQSCGMDV